MALNLDNGGFLCNQTVQSLLRIAMMLESRKSHPWKVLKLSWNTCFPALHKPGFNHDNLRVHFIHYRWVSVHHGYKWFDSLLHRQAATPLEQWFQISINPSKNTHTHINICIYYIQVIYISIYLCVCSIMLYIILLYYNIRCIYIYTYIYIYYILYNIYIYNQYFHQSR